MNVHNIMEDIVKARVDSLYEQLKNSNTAWLTCDCENCRADVISYVLNRVTPKYVVSGRGVTHSSELLDDHQLRADINAICLDGIRIISSTKRPFHSLPREECTVSAFTVPTFNFPTFVGTILDGHTFEPVANAKILLKQDGKIAEMVDQTWINPACTYASTKGSYSFWVKSIPAEKVDESKKFNFSLEVSAEGYDSIIYNFEASVVSENKIQLELNTVNSIKIKDLVIFREGTLEGTDD